MMIILEFIWGWRYLESLACDDAQFRGHLFLWEMSNRRERLEKEIISVGGTGK